MASANVRWVSGKQFVERIQQTLGGDFTPDEGVGMKPSDLLLVALAACTAVDVVDTGQRTPLSGLEFRLAIRTMTLLDIRKFHQIPG
jgi:putative redox protein